jgi:hypothetical protein
MGPITPIVQMVPNRPAALMAQKARLRRTPPPVPASGRRNGPAVRKEQRRTRAQPPAFSRVRLLEPAAPTARAMAAQAAAPPPVPHPAHALLQRRPALQAASQLPARPSATAFPDRQSRLPNLPRNPVQAGHPGRHRKPPRLPQPSRVRSRRVRQRPNVADSKQWMTED